MYRQNLKFTVFIHNMRINNIFVNKLYPVFTSNNKRVIHREKPDTFEKEPFNLDNAVNSFYRKLEKQMQILSPKDIELKARNIAKITNTPIEDVYKTMGMLSGYSSFKSIENIENYMKNKNISLISNLSPLFEREYGNTDNMPICLTNVLHYISLKNFDYAPDYTEKNDYKKVLFLDSKFFKILDEMPQDELNKFKKEYLKKRNIKLVYIENFENSYNFLNQGDDFEKFTINVIKKAKKYQNINKKDLPYNVRYVLNGENYKNIKKLSDEKFKINEIKIDYPCTPAEIADNLKPIMPSKDEIKNIIKEISKNQEEQKKLFKFLDEMMIAYSPRLMSKSLQQMHNKILKVLEKDNRFIDDLYFIIPAQSKSFSLINYMYTKVNNIDNPQNIHITDKSRDKDLKYLQLLPQNSTLAILDDCMESGLSLSNEIFHYNEASYVLSKDKKIIFAPLVSTECAQKNLQDMSNKFNREDKIITNKIISAKKFKKKGDYNIDITTTSLIFPYMGPDFNYDKLVPLYEKFLYTEEAQKIPITDLVYHIT